MLQVSCPLVSWTHSRWRDIGKEKHFCRSWVGGRICAWAYRQSLLESVSGKNRTRANDLPKGEALWLRVAAAVLLPYGKLGNPSDVERHTELNIVHKLHYSVKYKYLTYFRIVLINFSVMQRSCGIKLPWFWFPDWECVEMRSFEALHFSQSIAWAAPWRPHMY